MLTSESIHAYGERALMAGKGYIYVRPHPALAPYIANYTLTFPPVNGMPKDYTVLPTASSTLVYSHMSDKVTDGLRGVNSKAVTVGGHATQCSFLLLVEFHPGGLFPFAPIAQNELLDRNCPFQELNPAVHKQLTDLFAESTDIASLVKGLDQVFLSGLGAYEMPGALQAAMAVAIEQGGMVRVKDLAQASFYSEKHLNRLFKRYIGTGIKTFTRIVRINHTLRLFNAPGMELAQLPEKGAYYDQAHFTRDFKALCGVTPGAYLDNMSIFYNDRTKL